MKCYLTIIATMLSTAFVWAQESTPFNSSRPGQAFTPLTVGKSSIQLQSGFSVSDIWDQFDDGSTALYFSALGNNNTFRYGLSDKVELRAEVNSTRQYENFLENGAGGSASGATWMTIGSRILLSANDEKSQYLSIQSSLTIPLWERAALLSEPDLLQLLLAYSRPFLTKATLTANLSVSTSDFFRENQVGYVLNVAFPISKKLGGFVEHYGSLTAETLLPSWDAGLAFMLKPDLQLDLSAGFGEVDTNVILGMQQWFVDTGISWRIRNGSSKTE